MQKILNKKNVKNITSNMVYIGRPYNNTLHHFGNPFSHLENSKASVKVNSRDEAIEYFDDWIHERDYLDVEPERRNWILNNLYLLEDKDLVCYCSPLICHGDVYIELLKERYNAKDNN